MERIGVFGGTFNPIHAQHVEVLKEAIATLQLDKMIVMPTFMPPHKNKAPAPAIDRLNMLRLAVGNISKVEVSDYEIEKGGKSYTYQTMEHLKSVYPNAELFFLVGADMLKDFKTWKYPERILAACTLVACGRDNSGVSEAEEEKYFLERFNKSFIKLSYSGKDFSSTKIRVYTSLGVSLQGVCIPAVEEYIKIHNLYEGGEYEAFIKKVLTEKRIRHTANVIITALKKAKETGLDEEKIKISALLHDCAKYLDPKDYPDFTMPEGVPDPVVHAYLGAYVAEKVLKITDEEIIDAIRYHTSGKANMSTLAKLIFVADMIEEDRFYQGVEELRKAYEVGLDYCFKECLKEETVHLLNRKKPIYVETLNAYEYYINGDK